VFEVDFRQVEFSIEMVGLWHTELNSDYHGRQKEPSSSLVFNGSRALWHSTNAIGLALLELTSSFLSLEAKTGGGGHIKS